MDEREDEEMPAGGFIAVHMAPRFGNGDSPACQIRCWCCRGPLLPGASPRLRIRLGRQAVGLCRRPGRPDTYRLRTVNEAVERRRADGISGGIAMLDPGYTIARTIVSERDTNIHPIRIRAGIEDVNQDRAAD